MQRKLNLETSAPACSLTEVGQVSSKSDGGNRVRQLSPEGRREKRGEENPCLLLALLKAVFNVLRFYRHGQGAADAVNTHVAGSSFPSSS